MARAAVIDELATRAESPKGPRACKGGGGQGEVGVPQLASNLPPNAPFAQEKPEAVKFDHSLWPEANSACARCRETNRAPER